MERTKLTRRIWFRILLLIGLWTVPGVLFGSQLYFLAAIEGRPVVWIHYVGWQLVGWYFWALATPVILWLGRRVPVGRPRPIRGVLFHLAVAAVTAFVSAAWSTWLARPIAPYPYFEFDPAFYFQVFALQRIHTSLLTYAMILGVGYGLDYYRKFRERELQASQLQAQLAQAQLEALKMQLHPHFLFNTLNAIAMLVRKGGQSEAVRMLAGLSDLLRLALENAGTDLVTLKQELDFLERYLELQRIRFQDRLTVRLDVAPETLNACIPNLILQPIVENAIRHGIDAHAEAGLVEIIARRDDGRLHVEVRDDGPGLEEAERRAGGEGVGLSNTRKRLRRMYGEDHLFELGNAAGRGALAVLEIPYESAEDRG